MTPWIVPRLWPDETVFIVAGGPSVAEQNTDALSGQKVIAIKSSYERVRFADYVIFSDMRWWTDHQKKLAPFKGRVVAVNAKAKGDGLLIVNRRNPPGLSDSPSCLTVNWTILTAAIDLAVMLGARRLVLLGADGKRGPSGRCHHHSPHSWPWKDNLFDKQREELKTLVEPLKSRDVSVVNCSPGSTLPFWPIMPLADYLMSESKVAVLENS